MNRFPHAIRSAVAATLAIACWPASAQQAAHLLPQAFPGTSYAAQLAIPPGLGYPFAKCELKGASPRWLTLDCSRLQIKGKVPATGATDSDLHITLRIEDNVGNTREFPLSLRVSANPQVVSLEEPAARQADPRASAPRSLEPQVKADPASISQAPIGEGAAENNAVKPPVIVVSTNSTTAAVESEPPWGTASAGTDAAALSAAAAQLRPASVQGASRRSSRSPRANLAAAAPKGLNAYAGAAAACSADIPRSGDAASKEDQDAITHLTTLSSKCTGTKNANCVTALTAMQADLPKTIAGLQECAENGDYITAAGADLAKVTAARNWYRGRAALWQGLADDIANNGASVKDGSYKLASLELDLLKEPSSTTAVIRRPIILAPLTDGAVSISVSASPGSYLSFFSVSPSAPSCDDIGSLDKHELLQLKKSSTDSTAMTSFATTTDSVQTVLPQQPVHAGMALCAIESLNATPPDLSASGYVASDQVTVQDNLNWGRVRAYFVGGALISNTQNSFSSSSANQFLDLNVDKFWVIPDCASVLNPDGDCAKHQFHRWPGVSTYFDTRLTAIPVAVKNATTTAADGTTTSVSTGNPLSTQKTARVQVGAYFPFILANWSYNNSGNALYVAPIAKVGFDTLTGSTNPTGTIPTTGSSSMTVQANLDRVYNFYSFGARVGHFGLYPTKNKSPELQSYFDISFGPYSNLPSFICEQAKGVAPAAGVTSSCGPSDVVTYNGQSVTLPYASEKRIWRLDLEGLLKVPSTPLVIGFNANIGQKAVGAQNLDTQRVPGDDVRFLFGTKFDIACVMRKLGVGQTGTSATETGSCF